MSMKRFLVLFTLIAFSVVSCAGPNKVKVGWTKPDFRQDEFERDRKDCFQTYDNSLDPDPFGWVVDECLAKKGYKYETPAESPPDREDTATTVGKVLLVIGVVVVFVSLAAVYVALGTPAWWVGSHGHK
jgi:hypothetical protein